MLTNGGGEAAFVVGQAPGRPTIRNLQLPRLLAQRSPSLIQPHSSRCLARLLVGMCTWGKKADSWGGDEGSDARAGLGRADPVPSIRWGGLL